MRRARWLLLAIPLAASPTVGAQAPLPPQAPFQSIPQEMRFEQPTLVAVRLTFLDPYEDAVWVEWIERHDGSAWVAVPGGRQFKLFPADAGMLRHFRSLALGTRLSLTVQTDPDGNRRVLHLHDGT